ncbi:MarR family winged helix-turn-helix transcriptional regulator [Olivibacter sitiensis]|uniref:MarR family winged helix-turn-helix transcriptional regulator n=1 Tax=Olivibacter sitiensis TaxID=376470 RepID=UPI0004185FAC
MMKIEEVLKTDKFENDYHKAVLNIVYTSNYVNGLLKVPLSKQKVTLQQYNILRILRGQYPSPATVNLIKERLLDHMSDVSRIIDRLVEKQLVSRKVCPSDRRAVDICITDKGLALLEKLDPLMSVHSVLDNNLTDEECLQLNYLLDKLRG